MKSGRARGAAILLLVCVAIAHAQSGYNGAVCTETVACATLHECEKGHCAHKDIWPISGLDIVCFLICFFGGIISVVGGTGGGGLFVPVLMIVTKFQAQQAAPLSKSMILGAALISYWYEFRLKIRGKPSVDYDVCLLLQPMLLIGTIIGVFLNVLLPGWAIVIILTVVLGTGTSKTLSKGIEIYRSEKRGTTGYAIPRLDNESSTDRNITDLGLAPGERADGTFQGDRPRLLLPRDADLNASKDSGTPGSSRSIPGRSGRVFPRPAVVIDHAASTADANGTSAGDVNYHPVGTENTVTHRRRDDDDRSSSALGTNDLGAIGPAEAGGTTDDQMLLSKENTDIGPRPNGVEVRAYHDLLRAEKSIPWKKVLMLVGVWLMVDLSVVIRQQIPGCGPWFWVVALFPVPLSLIMTMVVGKRLRTEYELKAKCGHSFLKTDYIFNKKHTLSFPFIAFIGGLSAGMVGIGGGVVIGPILLMMSEKSDPDATAAVSTTLLVFTAAATTSQFLFIGTLPWGYAIFLVFNAAVSAVVARRFAKPLIDRYNAKSYIYLSAAMVTGISCILSFVLGIVDLKENGPGFQHEVKAETLCHFDIYD